MRVLVTKKWNSGKKVYHLPDEDNPEKPKCSHADFSEWCEKDKSVLVGWRICKDCEDSVDRSHTGPKLANVLLKMDPEAV